LLQLELIYFDPLGQTAQGRWSSHPAHQPANPGELTPGEALCDDIVALDLAVQQLLVLSALLDGALDKIDWEPVLVGKIRKRHQSEICNELAKLLEEECSKLMGDICAIDKLSLASTAQVHDCRLDNFNTDADETRDVKERHAAHVLSHNMLDFLLQALRCHVLFAVLRVDHSHLSLCNEEQDDVDDVALIQSAGLRWLQLLHLHELSLELKNLLHLFYYQRCLLSRV